MHFYSVLELVIAPVLNKKIKNDVLCAFQQSQVKYGGPKVLKIITFFKCLYIYPYLKRYADLCTIISLFIFHGSNAAVP